MATPLIMPKFGMAQEEATIVRWFKGEGDEVKLGEPLLEVTTDKVNMEVEATSSGILRGLRHGEGDVVPVAIVIGYIVEAGEKWTPPEEEPKITAPIDDNEAAPIETEPVRATAVARRLAEEQGTDLHQIAGTGPRRQITRSDVERFLATTAQTPDPAGKVRATPAARRIAQEEGIDLSAVTGTGPRGRIQEADVRQTLAALPIQQVPPRAGSVLPLTGMRAAIAQRMQQSYQTAPHIHLTLSADVSEAEAARLRWAERTGEKVSLTVLLVKACAWALRHHAAVNATLDDEGIHLWDEINIGVAVALPDGLIVPVLRQADTKPVGTLARELRDLSQRAQEGQLRPDEVSGGTFTLTNLGMFGIESFDPILNPPESAILGVGVAVPTPVVLNDEVAIRPRMQLTLAADHRALDGAMAAQFLQDVKAAIEDPVLLLL